jgi:hypothetical protein
MSTAKHGCDFQIIERSPGNRTQTWQAKCSCRAQWTGPTYEAVEDEWRKHYHGIKGEAPKPMGSKSGRWMP